MSQIPIPVPAELKPCSSKTLFQLSEAHLQQRVAGIPRDFLGTPSNEPTTFGHTGDVYHFHADRWGYMGDMLVYYGLLVYLYSQQYLVTSGASANRVKQNRG